MQVELFLLRASVIKLLKFQNDCSKNKTKKNLSLTKTNKDKVFFYILLLIYSYDF